MSSPAGSPSPNASPPPGQRTGVASPSPGQMANATPGGSSPVAPSVQTPGAPWPIQTAGLPPMYSAAWHHVHLYAPRTINLDSNMPAYRFLYEKRRITGERSADALQLSGADAPPEGWEVVPTLRCKMSGGLFDGAQSIPSVERSQINRRRTGSCRITCDSGSRCFTQSCTRGICSCQKMRTQ